MSELKVEEEEEDLSENCLVDTMTPPVTMGVGVSSITVWTWSVWSVVDVRCLQYYCDLMRGLSRVFVSLPGIVCDVSSAQEPAGSG